MIKDLINQFRKDNGRHPIALDNHQENDYCFFHCKHMANIQDCQHSPSHLRQGKAEAVGVRSFFRDYDEALRGIIFEDFGGSIDHRNVMLFNDDLAAAFHVRQNMAYVCIRGK